MMFDPVNSWMRWNDMALAMMTNSAKMSEVWMASGRVIDHRLGLVKADAGSIAAQGELARMVPEKVTAFSQSGWAAMFGWWAMQGDMMRLGQEMATSAWRMQPPSPKAMRASMARTQRIAGKMTKTATAMVTPVHKTVTANDRRLKKTR